MHGKLQSRAYAHCVYHLTFVSSCLSGSFSYEHTQAKKLRHLIQNFVIDKDRQRRVVMHSQGDRVAGAAVEFDHVIVFANADLSVIRMFNQMSDDDILGFAAQFINGVLKQIVRQRSRRCVSLNPAVDAHRLEQANQDWKRAGAPDLSQEHDLLVVNLTDNDAG